MKRLDKKRKCPSERKNNAYVTNSTTGKGDYKPDTDGVFDCVDTSGILAYDQQFQHFDLFSKMSVFRRGKVIVR